MNNYNLINEMKVLDSKQRWFDIISYVIWQSDMENSGQLVP
jgi:hypothetical protein